MPLKGPRKDWVLGFGALTHDDTFAYLISICGVCEIGNNDLLYTLLQDQHYLRINYIT